MHPNIKQEHIRIDFIPKHTDGELRCKNCRKLLGKIKKVDKRMVIDIKCPRSKCGLLNTFIITRNDDYKNDEEHSDKMINFKFGSKT